MEEEKLEVPYKPTKPNCLYSTKWAIPCWCLRVITKEVVVGSYSLLTLEFNPICSSINEALNFYTNHPFGPQTHC